MCGRVAYSVVCVECSCFCIYKLWTPLLAMNSLCWNLTMTLFRKSWPKKRRRKEEVQSPVHDADGKAVQKVVMHVHDVGSEVGQEVLMLVHT